LGGRAVVVTRPERQAAALASLIEAAGGRALRVPAIEITPLRSAGLEAVVARIDAFDIAVFISRNAVEQGMACVRESGKPWPPGIAVAAIGAGTRLALEAEGRAGVISPSGPADSEALLAEQALADVTGKRVVIFRGEGGREALAEGLRARGALVEYAECYRRSAPAIDPLPLIGEWSRGGLHAIAVSSGEGLANLATSLRAAGRPLLASVPVFVPHPRVAAQARELGAADVVVTGAGDDEVVAALVAYFRRTG
jgi:uroporphyrinogen-III synthase